MKLLIAIATLIAAPAISLAHDAGHAKKPTTAAAPAADTAKAAAPAGAETGKKYDVVIKGMHCASCANSVTEALNALPSTLKGSVKVNISKNTATLAFSSGTEPELRKQVEEAIKSVNFEVDSMTAAATAKN